MTRPSSRSYEEWGAHFQASGVDVGQPMPAFTVSDLHGAPVPLGSRWAHRPLVLFTASLTCPIARGRLPQMAAHIADLEGRISRVVVYTREAHPQHDPAPHADGVEWLTPANERDGILVRQPTDDAARRALAKRFAEAYADGFEVLVDGLDDAFYRHFGTAPSMGLLIGTDGAVRVKEGWAELETFPGRVKAAL